MMRLIPRQSLCGFSPLVAALMLQLLLVGFFGISSPLLTFRVTIWWQRRIHHHDPALAQLFQRCQDLPGLSDYRKEHPECIQNQSSFNGIDRSLIDHPDRLNLSQMMLQNLSSDMGIGGYYEPPGCRAKTRLAIIVPYFNRASQLPLFLAHLIKILKQQQIAFKIYIIEFVGDSRTRFSRSLLLNVGAIEAQKDAQGLDKPPWCCFDFADVDKIPVDDRLPFSCPNDGILNLLWHNGGDGYFPGNGIINAYDFERMNGYSNLYFGYAAEDNEIAMRAKSHGFQIVRVDSSPQQMVHAVHDHKLDKNNPYNWFNYRLPKDASRRSHFDGLSCLEYKVKAYVEMPTHTVVKVSYSEDNIFGRFMFKCGTSLEIDRMAKYFRIDVQAIKSTFEKMLKDEEDGDEPTVLNL